MQPIRPSVSQPLESVAMRQSWRWLTFLHWPYDPDQVRPLLPPALKLDTFEGAAWIGLVPFEIHNFRGLRDFPETNVRTYVIDPAGCRAVWFFSLDADRLAAVAGARIGYGLPYFWASMRVIEEESTVRYQSRRRWPHARNVASDISVQPGEPFCPEELTERDYFLTARYRLCALRFGQLVYGQIEHEAWPLARCRLVKLQQTFIEAAGLASPQGAPLVHFSPDLDVGIGYPRRYA